MRQTYLFKNLEVKEGRGLIFEGGVAYFWDNRVIKVLEGFHAHDLNDFAVLLGAAQSDFYSQCCRRYHEGALLGPWYKSIIYLGSVSAYVINTTLGTLNHGYLSYSGQF